MQVVCPSLDNFCLRFCQTYISHNPVAVHLLFCINVNGLTWSMRVHQIKAIYKLYGIPCGQQLQSGNQVTVNTEFNYSRTLDQIYI